MIFYPDSVANPFSMMSFLLQQAKDAERKEQRSDPTAVAGKRGRRGRNAQRAEVVIKRLPTGEDRRENDGPKFDGLFKDKAYETDFNEAHLHNLRSQA